jgi:hypothetical protein
MKNLAIPNDAFFDRKGARAFLRDRMKRLGIPLAVFSTSR